MVHLFSASAMVLPSNLRAFFQILVLCFVLVTVAESDSLVYRQSTTGNHTEWGLFAHYSM
jgi:hypothetical protein